MEPLSVKVNLLSREDVPEKVLSRLAGERNGPVRMNGWFWFRSENQVLCWKDNEAGETVCGVLKGEGPSYSGRDDPWRMILTGRTPDACPPEMRDGVARCVMLFEAPANHERLLQCDAVADLAPMERGDALTEIAPGKIALIKVSAGHTEEEIREYAAAVAETVETEAGIPVQGGIGRSVADLAGLRDSLYQAEQALDIGRRFRLAGSVFEYAQLIVERLISAVPAADQNRMRQEVFTGESERLMTDEMLETVQVFFRNDLNLSTTARELFIHRNTLIYRLDKIRKMTGFDLRKFQDASAFQLLCRLPADCENHDHPRWEK